ncbi:MFS transporter [Pseudonocardia sp. T1-2H]|uniref:MFS transporter n=1 Tax=Pseudonocardia sp. T1-2H TaxID=3128899 RepID=UPI0031017700
MSSPSSAPTAATTRAEAPVTPEQPVGMTHRQVLEALSGLFLALFTAMLSATIVSNALPTIITDLHGSQSQYTWLVTATLLSSTASTPIWGKLSDLVNKKLLVQLAILLYVGGSVAAGFSTTVPILIGWRAVQGLGLGALQSLVVIVMAAMISPRERGRYTGPMAAVMSVATVAGPLIGGVIVDTSWLGWRWCFFVGVPFAVAALILVQRTLNLPVVKRKVVIDYLGAVLIASGVCDLLIWVTLAGNDFEWASGTSFLMLGAGVVLLALAVFVESRAAEPIIPLRLFKDRTTTLATVASIAVGVAMFGSAVFLGQYFQIARGYSPTAAGLLTLPMILGSTVSATVSGALISKLGRWKGFLVGGSVLLVAGFGLLATIDHQTDMILVGVYLAVLGLGLGMTMQNLVLAVQNTVSIRDLGAASSTVGFFRSLGGTIGVSVLGAVLATHVANLTTKGLTDAGVPTAGSAASGEVGIGSLNQLPPLIAGIVRASYGDGTARIFLIAAFLSVITLVAVLFIKEVPLRTASGLEQQAGAAGPAPAAGPALVTAAPVAAAGAAGAPAAEVWHAGRHTVPAHHAPAPVAPAPVGQYAAGQYVAGPTVHGRVTSANGAGLAGAVITLTASSGVQAGRAVSDRDGSYAVALPTGGTYLLVAASGALQPHAVMVPVAEGALRHDVLLSGTSHLAGTVRLPDPRFGPVPAEAVTVTLIDARGDVAGSARSDVDGRYRIDGVAAGWYTLTASGEGHQPVASAVELLDGLTTERDLELPAPRPPGGHRARGRHGPHRPGRGRHARRRAGTGGRLGRHRPGRHLRLRRPAARHLHADRLGLRPGRADRAGPGRWDGLGAGRAGAGHGSVGPGPRCGAGTGDRPHPHPGRR